MKQQKFVINGGVPLKGNVSIDGAKNAAVAILPATILCGQTCIIENLPMISDVLIILSILKRLGAQIEHLSDGAVRINTSNISGGNVDIELVRRLRASYYLVGALLGKTGEASILLPGGCAIGQRPIDLHLKGFNALGAETNIDYGKFSAKADKLVGAEIYLDTASVGATINIMLAAVLAEGQTTILNAAKEPHVVDVANFLTAMGAKIKGAGTDIIRIYGVEKLHGCWYSVIPDQIETGTFMLAALATGGDITVTNAIPVHMEALSAKLLEMGAIVQEGDDYLRVAAPNRLRGVTIKTLPYPGFPTDLQQPISVLLAIASGTGTIVETIFESRFKHLDELALMGAKVRVDDRIAVFMGVSELRGCTVNAGDLRAGAALIIAGLAAKGTTEVFGINYVDRGYNKIEKKLVSLGADIKRVEVKDEEFEFGDLF